MVVTANSNATTKMSLGTENIRKCVQEGVFWTRGGTPKPPKVTFGSPLGSHRGILVPGWITLGGIGEPLWFPWPLRGTSFRVFLQARVFTATRSALLQKRDEKEGSQDPSEVGYRR